MICRNVELVNDMPDRERELWACALLVFQKHGDKAPIYLAERLGSMAIANDEAGIATWQAIARHVYQLMHEGGEIN